MLKKSKYSIKTRIIYMFSSHFGRLILASILIAIGGILGTDGLLEIKSQEDFWNWVMYTGILVWIIYLVIGLYYSIKNAISDLKEMLRK